MSLFQLFALFHWWYHCISCKQNYEILLATDISQNHFIIDYKTAKKRLFCIVELSSGVAIANNFIWRGIAAFVESSVLEEEKLLPKLIYKI
jgi:hypothetical protein